MNKLNSYSLTGRYITQQVAPRAVPVYAPSRTEARERVKARATRRQTVFVPRWLVFLALVGLTFSFCLMLNHESSRKMNSEREQQNVLRTEIEKLQSGNQALAEEVTNLQNDSATIQRYARQRLGMILPSERILVPAR